MNRQKNIGLLSLCTLALTVVLVTKANAVTTQKFVLDDASALSAGELEGTSVHSSGFVSIGTHATRTEIADTPLAYSLLRMKKSAFLVGTGTSGKIFEVDGKKVREYADTKQLLISSLAMGRKGDVFAATIPDGQIFRIDKRGKLKLHTKLANTEHIWALVYDRSRDRLIAGTGPNGVIFAIDKKGNAKELLKLNASHIMSLAIGDGGDLYAGTSDDALVLKIDKNNKATAFHDFEGNEITSIAYNNGVLAVVVNEFKKPSSTFITPPRDSEPSRGKAAPARPPRNGKGRVWKVGPDGRAELLFKRDDGHFSSIDFDDQRAIYVGSGHKGRIYKILQDGTHTTWLDVDERQVLAMDFNEAPHAFVTGDSAAFYKLDDGIPKKSRWTSKVLDAKFRSQWGQLAWRANGKIDFQTRSGNTLKPSNGWSDWSKAKSRPGQVQSPAARFIQIRARFHGKRNEVLNAVELYYLPQNQRTIVRKVELKADKGKDLKKKRTPTTKYTLKWDSENPDKDVVQYKVSYRREGQTKWRKAFKDDVTLLKTEYEWDTSGLPDGYYIIKVEASDEQANTAASATNVSAISEPIRIDNHPPHVDNLRMRRGKITGRVQDDLGPITEIQVAIDGGDWKNIYPDDQLLDEKTETFSIPTAGIEKGSRIIAVRAKDAAANSSSAEITTTIK